MHKKRERPRTVYRFLSPASSRSSTNGTRTPPKRPRNRGVFFFIALYSVNGGLWNGASSRIRRCFGSSDRGQVNCPVQSLIWFLHAAPCGATRALRESGKSEPENRWYTGACPGGVHDFMVRRRSRPRPALPRFTPQSEQKAVAVPSVNWCGRRRPPFVFGGSEPHPFLAYRRRPRNQPTSRFTSNSVLSRSMKKQALVSLQASALTAITRLPLRDCLR